MRALVIGVSILSAILMQVTSCAQRTDQSTSSDLAAIDQSIEGRVVVWEFVPDSKIKSVNVGSVGNNNVGIEPNLRSSAIKCEADGGFKCTSRKFSFQKPQDSHIASFSYKNRNGFAYCAQRPVKTVIFQCMEIRFANGINLAAKFAHKNIVYRQGTVIQAPTCKSSTSDASSDTKVFSEILMSQAGFEDYMVRIDSTGWSEAECIEFYTHRLKVGDSIVVLGADFLPRVPGGSEWESDFEILRTLQISSESDVVIRVGGMTQGSRPLF